MIYMSDEEMDRLGLEDTGIDIEYKGVICKMFGNDYEWYYMLNEGYGYLILEKGFYA